MAITVAGTQGENMMSKFKVGDVVVLNGHGAVMTVARAAVEGSSSVEVVWHNANKDPVFSLYPEEALRKYECFPSISAPIPVTEIP